MAFEKPGRLGEEEAHDEANLLRAQLKVSPETGRIDKYGGARDSSWTPETTAEDYDEALEKLEKLKELIKEGNSTYERAFEQLRQLSKIPILVGTFGDRLITALFEGTFSAFEGIKKGWKEGKRWTDEDIEDVFRDPESQLKRLKAGAKKFEGKGKSEKGSE